MTRLPATPATLVGPEGPLVGLWDGALATNAMPRVPGRGRVRRWSYAAAASTDGSLAVGAAIVDLGLAGACFAWVSTPGTGLLTWDRRLLGHRANVARWPGEDSRARHGRDRLTIRTDGGILAGLEDVGGLPLHLDLASDRDTGVVCATPTPGGGFNVTQKAAGHRVEGTLALGSEMYDLVGHGWSDWTAGRQDRHTAWRWAAGAGADGDGRAIGFNFSTGMNASGPGEDVVWVDGTATAVHLERLEPTEPGGFDGPWNVAGTGESGPWALRFEPVGVRAAEESLLVVRSRYVQPYGHFTGTLPAPDGGLFEVEGVPGVTEDHEAVW